MHPINPASDALASVAFGNFRVVPHRRELLADGQPIKLGGRAFDMLMALIDARGEVISKGALMARVWPDRVVEEKNLHVQISALRTALGAERELIHTVAGRGYQFTGEIRIPSASPDERAGAGAVEPEAVGPLTKLPEPVSELIGRDEELEEILRLAAANRLVTLTGAGGIGKTRLALAAARRLLPNFADGVWIAELAPLADPALVPAAIAAALGLEFPASAVSAEHLTNALSGKELLLVLDNCEHVIDSAARIAEALLRTNPAVHVIATSREPLKAEGERIYSVPPLAVPVAEGDDPWRYGAVWLFVVRSRASGAHVSEDRHVAPVIAAICRRLDGIPLAIELAAARVAVLGIDAVAARLDDRFQLLAGGRRTALPRHQTLRATLDWSFELLPEPERVILRRLAVFAGVFNLEAAGAVVASPEIAPSEVVDSLFDLVAKSLVAAEVDGTIARYRLLDTTRAYALEKLAEAGERERLARRHAEYYRDLFERAEAELEAHRAAGRLTEYARQIDNLRAALDWTFSRNGDASIGVALTAAAVPLWMHLSLVEECRGRAERALTLPRAGPNHDTRREMKLYAALGASLTHTIGRRDAPEIGTAWTKALELATSLNDTRYQLHSLEGLYYFHSVSGRNGPALVMAQKFCSLAAASADPDDLLIGERMIGVTKHYLGDQPSARRHIERVLANHQVSDHSGHIIPFQTDQRVSAGVFLSRILWLQGFPEQAMRAAEGSVEAAQAANHAISLCYALTFSAFVIAFWVGDLAAAEHYLGMLLDHSTRHALGLFHALCRSHRGMLIIKRGDVIAGLGLLRAGLDEFGRDRVAARSLIFLTEMAEALGRAGEIAGGLAVAEGAIARSEQNEGRWAIAELLRVKGELLLLQGSPAAAAEDHFRQALGWARQQGALSWELRTATSLARLLRDQSRAADALALLQPVYDRFTEGFDTADLMAAKALLDTLQ